MVEVSEAEYYRMLEEREQEFIPKKPSKFKRAMKGLGSEIGDFHRMMLRKKAEASARNDKLNKQNRRGKKPVVNDFNINHAHEKIKVGW